MLSTRRRERCCSQRYRRYVPEPIPEVVEGYGLLYNWFAATDVRGVAPTNFRVPTDADVATLFANFADTDAASIALKGTRIISIDGHPGWGDTSNGDNSSGMTLYAYGGRDELGDYEVDDMGTHLGIWYYIEEPSALHVFVILDIGGLADFAVAEQSGCCIRCVSDTEPATAIVTDIDGNAYNWVQIGTQYWLTNNLKTTKYNNGDSITTGLDNAAWAATTDGAWAYPNGDSSLPI